MVLIQMQRGGGEAATAQGRGVGCNPTSTTTGAADRLSVAAPGRCPVQRARQDAQHRTTCVNAGLHGPGVETRTGAGMLLLHLPARGLGGVSGKPAPHYTSGGGAATTAQGRGVGGAKLPPHQAMTRLAAQRHKQTCRAATTPQPNKQTRAAPCSKRRRGDAAPAPFCCPPPAGDWGRTGGGVYPQGARHNGLLCEPAGREAVAQLLCIRGRYVEHRHTTTAAGDHSRTVARAPHFPLPTARAACEPQAAGEVFSLAAQW